MYRQVFTPTELNNIIPVTIPQEWYGKDVEVIAFPLDIPEISLKNEIKFKTLPSRYSFSTKGFKLNRDEANDYE
jgi:hypothetical protein